MGKHQNSPTAKAWIRLKKNKPAIAGLCWIILVIVIAISGYSIAPDGTPDCDNQMVRIKLQPPGFKTDVALIHNDLNIPKRNIISRMFFGQASQYKSIPIKHHEFVNGTLQLQTFDDDALTYEGITADKFKITQQRFLLGTDNFGRDVLSRLILGARISLIVGFIAVFISLIIGITLGSLAGYLGGKVDDAIMFLVNTVWSIPTLLLVFAIVLAFGRGVGIIFLAVGLTMWVDVARIVRGQVLSVKEMQYIEAAQAFGFSAFRILFKHILPNILGPVMVIAAANFATAILLEAGLSYLGFGVQPPTPSWGTMLNENYGYAISGKPLLALIPALAVMLLVLSFNLLGNGLRDALDVKIKSAS